MKSAFITRNINKNGSFYKALIHQGFEVNGLSFIEFKAIQFYKLPTADWIFFYSKNGIRFFFDQLQQLNIDIQNLDYKWATIGQASANDLIKIGIKANFIGTGEPHSTAKSFIKIAQNQKIIFPRAANSKKSIQKILNHQIQQIDLVVYNNFISKNIKQRQEDFLVFTSPMNVKAYFNAFQLHDFQKVIAIGQTTAKALRELKINNLFISNQPSEASLAKKVLSIYNR